jgi:hypothetical protein
MLVQGSCSPHIRIPISFGRHSNNNPLVFIKFRCLTHDIIAISLKKSDNTSLDFINRFAAMVVLSGKIPYKQPFHEEEHINNRR